MFKWLLGSRNERQIKQLEKRVAKINALEPSMQAMTDSELSEQTTKLRLELQHGKTLDDILEEAFATVREVSVRTLGMRHFDVQLVGGMVLHMGKIAEMSTGEGKTLVATLAAYLNAIDGKGVHIVTINDYLAKRDAEWMGPIYKFLGLSVGVNVPQTPPEEKRAAYDADITYGTNNEFGFDYLRDNMAFDLQGRACVRPLNFAIVDEVDSILIDEARTPLIISGQVEDSTENYIKINKIVPQLSLQEEEEGEGDFTVDRKAKQVHLTEEGQANVEELLAKAGLLQEGDDLYSAANLMLLHHVNAALRAHHLFQRDVDYIVTPEQEIVIVDEHTGRALPGRRWSEGLHQAVEAKEGVPVQSENQTLASITFQNFFRLYDKLAGMTGTADTEAFEFQEIYGLEVIVIPTNRDCVRDDKADLVYQKGLDKYKAIVDDVKRCQETQQPVLLGTTSIENTEVIAKLLKKEKIPHQVLNAKFHEKEAHIIMEAGKPGAVTIATNMAGRGTDIVLGGNLKAEIEGLGENATQQQKDSLRDDWEKRHAKVMEAGGLHVIGSERHESRRIDNQLRGRSGRQGDPGSSQFYLSLEDPLMRIFASDRVANLMQKLGLEEDHNIESKMVTRAIEKAQRRVETYHFDIRKQLLEFDNVANEQRKVIYDLREKIMTRDDLTGYVEDMKQEVFADTVHIYMPSDSIEEQWETQPLEQQLLNDFNIECPVQTWLDADENLSIDDVIAKVAEKAEKVYRIKEEQLGADMMRKYEKGILLQILDTDWREHLAAMDYMRQSIGLRGFAQKDPKQEYKREAFKLFTEMLDEYKFESVKALMRFRVASENDLEELERRRRVVTRELKPEEGARPEEETGHKTFVRTTRKIGRNEPCYCGSGKKFKHCHGTIENQANG
jgi:preprotein translocase subunit SecA